MFFALLILLTSKTTLSNEIFINKDLIQEYRPSSSHRGTKVYKNKKGKKQITYLGVDHINQLPPTLSNSQKKAIISSVLQTLEEEINRLKPTRIIIEGLEYREGEGHPAFKDFQNCNPKNFAKKLCTEAGYATFLAKKYGSSIVGGESSNKEESNYLRSQGISKKDITFFKIAQIITVESRDIDADRTIPKNKRPTLKELFHFFSKGQGKFNDFKRWYKEKLNKSFTKENLDTQDFAPIKGKGPLSYIASLRNRPRERTILTAIEDSLKEHDRVLIIYGKGHLYKHKEALDDSFKKKGEIVTILPKGQKKRRTILSCLAAIEKTDEATFKIEKGQIYFPLPEKGQVASFQKDSSGAKGVKIEFPFNSSKKYITSHLEFTDQNKIKRSKIIEKFSPQFLEKEINKKESIQLYQGLVNKTLNNFANLLVNKERNSKKLPLEDYHALVSCKSYHQELEKTYQSYFPENERSDKRVDNSSRFHQKKSDQNLFYEERVKTGVEY